jgi:electron transfer flavoprotein alpha subunit
MGEILVVAEHRKQRLADISREMLTKGRQLADDLGNELVAVIIGSNASELAAEISGWADKVLAVRDERMEGSLAEPCQKILSPLIRQKKPRLVLIGHSSFGVDLAPALAIELGVPLSTDCTDIFIDNGNIMTRRLIYNGKIEAVFSFVPSETIMVTGRPSQFPIEKGNKRGTIEESESPLREETHYKRFEGYIEPEMIEVDITESNILMSIGRGIKSKENVAVAQQLAKLIGGGISCSRPIVDYGWLSSDYQVGLSGKTVKPKLYIALGISGAFQHVAGMKASEIIVAVNKDPKSPIFSVADYGIFDDVSEFLTAMIGEIRRRKTETESSQ